MSADIMKFEDWAGSARGLTARLMIGQDIVYRDQINSISYEIYNLTDGGSPVTGTIDPDEVLFDELQTDWGKDLIGYTFLWVVPGTLWNLAGKKYRVVITFTTTSEHNGVSFVEVWQNTTKSITA